LESFDDRWEIKPDEWCNWFLFFFFYKFFPPFFGVVSYRVKEALYSLYFEGKKTIKMCFGKMSVCVYIRPLQSINNTPRCKKNKWV